MSSDNDKMGCLGGILLNLTVWGSFILAFPLATRYGFSIILTWISLITLCAVIWRYTPLLYSKIKAIAGDVHHNINSHISEHRFYRRYRSCTQTEAQSLLIESIRTGNIKHIQVALNNGADVNQRDENKVTPLMAAATGKQLIDPYYRELDEAWCEKHLFITSSPDILRLLLNYNPDTDNIIESYKLAQISGRDANFGPWATNITEVTNSTAIEILSEYMEQHNIDISLDDMHNGITDENIHTETPFGTSADKEIC